jgi:hypothetical protein
MATNSHALEQSKNAFGDRVVSCIGQLLNRRNKNVAAVALANKNARIVWTLLAHDRKFRLDYAPAIAASSATGNTAAGGEMKRRKRGRILTARRHQSAKSGRMKSSQANRKVHREFYQNGRRGYGQTGMSGALG